MAKVKDLVDEGRGLEILHDDDGDAYLYLNGAMPGTVVPRKKFLKAVAKELNVAIYEVGHVTGPVAISDPILGLAEVEFTQSDVGYHKAS